MNVQKEVHEGHGKIRNVREIIQSLEMIIKSRLWSSEQIQQMRNCLPS